MLIWVIDLAQFDRAEVELDVAQTCKVMGCSSQPSSSDRNELFLKDVYLLPRPMYDRVPRREAKANLQKEGFCIDAFTFDKRWDEQTLRDKMAMLFCKILKDLTRY